MLYWNGNVLKSVCSAEKKCIYIYTFFALVVQHYMKRYKTKLKPPWGKTSNSLSVLANMKHPFKELQ